MTPWYSSAVPLKMIKLFNFRTHLPISLHIDQDNNRSNSIQSFPIEHYYTLEIRNFIFYLIIIFK